MTVLHIAFKYLAYTCISIKVVVCIILQALGNIYLFHSRTEPVFLWDFESKFYIAVFQHYEVISFEDKFFG